MALLFLSGLTSWLLCYLFALFLRFINGHLYFTLEPITACVTWEVAFLVLWLSYGDAYRFHYSSFALVGWACLSVPLLAIALIDSARVAGPIVSILRIATVAAANLLFLQIVLATHSSMYIIGTATGYFCLLQISGWKLLEAVRTRPLPLGASRINILRTYANAAVMAWDVHVSDQKLLFASGFAVIVALDLATLWYGASRRVRVSGGRAQGTPMPANPDGDIRRLR